MKPFPILSNFVWLGSFLVSGFLCVNRYQFLVMCAQVPIFPLVSFTVAMLCGIARNPAKASAEAGYILPTLLKVSFVVAQAECLFFLPIIFAGFLVARPLATLVIRRARSRYPLFSATQRNSGQR